MRPSQPLPFRPHGYVLLESYSSLKRLWSYLDGAEREDRRVSLLRGDAEATCRRRVDGFLLPRAGALVDVERAVLELDDGFEPHPALVAVMAGDPKPLAEFLDEHYDLAVTFVIGMTRVRDLVLKADMVYRPRGDADLGVKLVPRRFSKDELRVLLDRACGLAVAPR